MQSFWIQSSRICAGVGSSQKAVFCANFSLLTQVLIPHAFIVCEKINQV